MTFLQILSRITTYQVIELHVYDNENNYKHFIDIAYNFLVDKEDKYIGLCDYLISLMLVEDNNLVLSIREA